MASKNNFFIPIGLAFLISSIALAPVLADILPLDELTKEAEQEQKDQNLLTQQTDPEDIADPNESFGNLDRAVMIQDIQVIGNQLVPTDVILENIKTKKGARFSRRKVAYDLKALDEMGYFDKNKLLAVPIPNGQEGVVLRIQVVENSPITGLIIKGNELIDKDQIEELLTPLIGMPRSSTQIRSAVEKIERVYHDKGYIIASVDELHFDPDGYLTVTINEGRIDMVAFEGNQRTKEDYLRKILPKDLQEGQPYNEQSIAKFMQGLKRSGYFKEIKREIKQTPEGNALVFQFEEQRTKALNVGTGAGTINGLFGQISFTEPNFRGQGETLSMTGYAGTGVLTALDGSTEGRFAQRGDFRFSFNYADPFVGNSDNSLGVLASAGQYGSFIVDSAIQRNLTGGVNFAFPIKGKENWSFQTGLSFSDNTIIGVGDAARNQLIDSLRSQEGLKYNAAVAEANRIRRTQLEDAAYIDLTPSFVYRKVDETGSGWRNTIFGGSSIGLGNDSYFTLGTDIRHYQRLTEDGWFFKSASHFESLIGNPANFRSLKMGGPYGMRGYRQFADIGIGTTMLSNTAEISIPFQIPKGPIKDTKLVFFNDIGTVLGENRLNDLYNRKSFAASIGVGLEVNIPFVGPMRIDYGIPLIRNDNRSLFSGRFTFNAGQQL
ncbi:MAG: POTRA domain-containing protein [Candidatus Caenarcaniphilales bacterium]|nr:POTRA domain-containing protein [Candidatus Caenarcaniphilales bacterium]